MPDTIGIAAIEDRSSQRCFRYVSWPALLDQRNPVLSKVIVSRRARGDDRLAAEETHRQIFGNRLQFDLLIAQAQTKCVALIAIRRNDIQTVLNSQAVLVVLWHKGYVIAGQSEVTLPFFLNQAQDCIGGNLVR